MNTSPQPRLLFRLAHLKKKKRIVHLKGKSRQKRGLTDHHWNLTSNLLIMQVKMQRQQEWFYR